VRRRDARELSTSLVFARDLESYSVEIAREGEEGGLDTGHGKATHPSHHQRAPVFVVANVHVFGTPSDRRRHDDLRFRDPYAFEPVRQRGGAPVPDGILACPQQRGAELLVV
jgi:hypothetical protein